MGALMALAATLTVRAVNMQLTRVQKRFQLKIMETKDDRMKTTTLVLRNMKTSKLQAWDNRHYLKNLDNQREKKV